MSAIVAALALGYLSGSLPWGLWIGRVVRGIDLREHGSKNLGATNAYRVLGPGLGILTLVLDVAKGALPVAWIPWWRPMDSFPGGPAWCAVTVGLAAVAGHVWTCFAGFKGGKGVATMVGVLLALSPAAFGVFVAVFVATVALTRYVSLGSILGSIALVIALAVWEAEGMRSPAFLLGVVLAVLVVARHRENLRRLARGEERKFSFSGARSS